MTWFRVLGWFSALFATAQAAFFRASLHNRTESRHIATASVKSPPDLLGDPSCMRLTGGICHLTACFTSRGPTECVDGRCLCQPGTCAMADGTCKPAMGKWLGTYAVSFAKAAISSKSYLGVDATTPYELPMTQQYPRHENAYLLSSTSSSEPMWKIAMTPDGDVRFQSEQLPHHVLMFYFNEVDPHGDEEKDDFVQWKDQIPHNYEIWPVVVPFEKALPLEITFQVRPTTQNGGGLEIWNPQTGYVLASIDTTSWVNTDRIERRGIAECPQTMTPDTCKGRQLVQFSPPLPSEATPSSSRKRFYHGEVYHLWQKVLVTVVWFSVFALIAFAVTKWMMSQQ